MTYFEKPCIESIQHTDSVIFIKLLNKMDPMSSSKIYIMIENFFSGLLFLQSVVIITGTLFSILHTSEDCENPVRTLLIVNSGVTILLLVMSFVWRWFGFIVWWIWNLFWSVLACIWILGDSSCDENFQFGYATGAVMIVLSYFLISTVVVISCFIGIAKNIEHGFSSHYYSA